MESRELRIGNLVKGVNSPHEFFTQVDLSLFVGLEQSTVTENDMEPIPLTEEWLIKLGFKKRYDSLISTIYEYELDPTFDYRITKEGHTLRTGLRWNGNYMPKCDYVHQLQNLIFALTGQELEIN